MKYTLSLFGLLSFMISVSQTIPNAGFEDWTTMTLWSDPQFYITSNLGSYFQYGLTTTEKTLASHQGVYAAHLQTEQTNDEPIPGSLILGVPSDMGDYDPISFNGMPDSLEVWIDHDIMPGDQGLIYVSLTSGGMEVAASAIFVSDASNGYVRYAAAVNYSDDSVIDGMILSVFSSNYNNPIAGSWMNVDDIHLVYGESAGDDVPNGDFEIWNDVTYNNPDDWSNSNIYTYPNISVSQTGDAHSGLSCARIESQEIMFDGGNNFGFIYLGDIVNETCDDQSLLIDNGVVITSVSGYYKYEPITTEDSASIYVFFRAYNDKTADCDSVYEAVKYLPAASDWTLFSMDVPADAISEIIQGQLPTHLTLACTSMKIPLGQEDIISEQGSVLWIDDLTYESIIVSVEDADALSITAFPNPASDLLRLNAPNQSAVKLAQLIDVQGRTVKQLDCNALNEAIDISGIDCGSYFVKVVSQDEVWVTTVLIER